MKTSKLMSKYERSKLIKIRAHELDFGAEAKIKWKLKKNVTQSNIQNVTQDNILIMESYDPITIAIEEFNRGLYDKNIIIRRILPNNKIEKVKAGDLIVI